MGNIEKTMRDTYSEARIQELERSLKESNCKINRLQRNVSELEAALEDKKAENARLRAKIVKLVERYV